jgi:hypothetical protein
MSVVRSPVRSVVRSPVVTATGAEVGQTSLQRILALSPPILYWRAENAGTVGIDGTGGTATGTSPVGRIIDLSGNARHASAPAIGNRAILNSTGWVFDGVDDYYSLSAYTVPTEVDIVRAFRRPTGLTASFGLGNTAANAPHDAFWSLDNNIYSWLSPASYIGSTATNANTGAFVLTARRTLTTETLRLNGAAVATSQTVSAGGTQLNSFGRRNANYNANEISFEGVFPRLSDTDLALVEQIAAATNGTTLA